MALEKNIKLKVIADTNDASQKLQNVDKSVDKLATQTNKLKNSTQGSNMMLLSTSRIVQDLPNGFMGVGNKITFLAEQMGYAKSQGIGFKDQLVGLGKSLAGPGGMIFLISAVTAGLTYFTSNIGKAKSSTDIFTESIDKAISKLIEFQDPLKNLKFGLSPEELNKIIPAIDKEIKSLEALNTERQKSYFLGQGTTRLDARSFTNQLTDAEKEKQKINQQMVEQLKKVKSEYEAQLKIESLLNNLGLKKVTNEKHITSELEKQSGIIKEITKGLDASYRFRLGGDASNRGGAGGAGLTSSFLGVGGIDAMTSGKAGKAKESEGFKNQVDFFVSQMKDGIGTIKGEFSTFWEDSFGEANSLLEKFLMNFAEGLMELALKQGFLSLLNMILPGYGALAGMAMGATRQPIVNNYNVDGRTFAQLVVNANKTATMLRMN